MSLFGIMYFILVPACVSFTFVCRVYHFLCVHPSQSMDSILCLDVFCWVFLFDFRQFNFRFYWNFSFSRQFFSLFGLVYSFHVWLIRKLKQSFCCQIHFDWLSFWFPVDCLSTQFLYLFIFLTRQKWHLFFFSLNFKPFNGSNRIIVATNSSWLKFISIFTTTIYTKIHSSLPSPRFDLFSWNFFI